MEFILKKCWQDLLHSAIALPLLGRRPIAKSVWICVTVGIRWRVGTIKPHLG